MFTQFITILSRIIRDSISDPLRRFQLSLAIIGALIIGGTLGYMQIEGWDVVDALYMTIITIATVGFGEVRELSETGRIFTIILIFLGVGAATTTISNAVSIILGPLLWSSIQQRRLENRIMTMQDHYIVCGYGRMGRQIVQDLRARDEKFVVVDAKESVAEELLEDRIPHITGNATEDDILFKAGLERARGLVAALSSDADNVMTVLTARELNPGLFIIARTIVSESESKLRRAGANRVINPYQIGGHRMAISLLRPAVHDFLNHIFHLGEGRNIDVGQLRVSEESHLAGQTIASCDLRSVHNVNILGIQKHDGEIIITPNPHTTLEPNSTLIVIGPPEAIYKLERQKLD